MSQKTFSLTAGLIFALIALGHILRIALSLQWMLAGRVIPMWVSWVALIVAAFLAYEGLRLSQRPA